MSWNYSVRLNDSGNLGGSADASLVYDLEQALAIWSQYILGIGTLVVDLVIGTTAVGRMSGGATSSFFIGTNAQGYNVFEPSSLYELTTGQHVGGTTSDITITVDTAYFSKLDLSYGLNYGSQVAGNLYNPIVVLLHELTHAFGMSGWYDQSGHLPGNYESPFDALIQKTSSGAFFVGANAESVYGGPVPITTNSTTQNYSHFGNQQSDINRSPSTVQDSLTLDLMNGIVFFPNYQYAISALDLAVLQDIGYHIRTVPVVTAHDLIATSRNQQFAASSLFSSSVSTGDSITQYALWDSNGNGHWQINGVVQPTNAEIDISAAQLAQTSYVSGMSGTDLLWVKAYDGVFWSAWQSFNVSAPADQVPVVSATNIIATRGQTSVSASSLFSVTDADNDAITRYAFWDTEGYGHWSINGISQATNQDITVPSASLS